MSPDAWEQGTDLDRFLAEAEWRTLDIPCPTCKVYAQEPCQTKDGKPARRHHTQRYVEANAGKTVLGQAKTPWNS